MDIEAIKKRAKVLSDEADVAMAAPFFQNVVARLGYLGLLRHNRIAPKPGCINLADALRAGELEPRILELLPALVLHLPDAVDAGSGDMPADLADVLSAIKRRGPLPPFRGIPAQKYLHWVSSPLCEQAGRRLRYRRRPRSRSGRATIFAETLGNLRLQRALTQKQMADQHDLSLRVIRDLEQGKLTASLKHVIEILSALDHKLEILPA